MTAHAYARHSHDPARRDGEKYKIDAKELQWEIVDVEGRHMEC